MKTLSALTGFLLGLVLISPVLSDPCGMVPPIYTGAGSPITRIGLQETYVYFDDGVESFVIRPGYQGKVDNFGMLIPFPNPPAIRKVPDSVFEQIAAAVDPPEVVIDLLPKPEMMMALPSGGGGGGGLRIVDKDSVRVVSQEAVGMYEVAVLETGSAAALQRWMTQNKYQYPTGMDDVAEDYIDEGWCFVAVKTKVGAKSDADPQPGQRNANPEMPAGSAFGGHVQGLGFRFQSKELVVPMRLSAFNEGDLRNVVYLLSRGGKKIRQIPEEYVVRQISGKQLIENLTQPLPLRIIGGTEKDIPDWRRKNLKTERDPAPRNGIAKQLFISDIVGTQTAGFALAHEETEKELLRIGEHFGLRGTENDKLIEQVSADQSADLIQRNLTKLGEMTLTVVDGDFPRQVLANQNLKFRDFKMAASRNTPTLYDTNLHGPAGKRQGILIGASLNELPDGYGQALLDRQVAIRPFTPPTDPTDLQPSPTRRLWTLLGMVGGLLIMVRMRSIQRGKRNQQRPINE